MFIYNQIYTIQPWFLMFPIKGFCEIFFNGNSYLKFGRYSFFYKNKDGNLKY